MMPMVPPQTEPTIDFHPTAEAPTLTRLGDGEDMPRSTPTNFAPPGYEIQGELGRGGMGVVYRARQKALNRLVALKVILGAGHAGADSLTRFRAEAITAAQLQHPNIVQVFEVSEHEGQPYFSLELVEGGSLADRLKGEPQPARESAEMIRTLALAVEHAHSKGVVHRDLKPANILLSGVRNQESGAKGDTLLSQNPSTLNAKITDFGLAKQREGNSGLTASGAVMGTPSYMAPEQASGHGELIGPATDVYALGAILYELLTGRPPFRAASVMDTVLQVMSDEPIPPSRLQPKLPRDLETICLKCLAKKPEQRYASAAALAEDLGRYLDGATILARPTSSLRKLGKWAKRYPALASIVFILAVPLPILLATMFFLWAQTREAKREIEAEKAAVVAAHAEAERERELAQQYLKNALLSLDGILERVGDDKLTMVPGIQEERAAIISEALRFYESLLRIDSTDPKVREQTAETFFRVARLCVMSGRTDQAAKAAESSVNLYNGLIEQFPDRPEFRNALAETYMFQGHSLILNSDFERGLKAYTAGAELSEALFKEFPDDPSYKSTAAECRRSIGYFYTNSGGDQAEANFKLSLKYAKELFEEHPNNNEYRALYASISGGYSQLLVNKGRLSDAAPFVKTGLELVKMSRESLPRKGNSRMLLDQGTIMLKLSAASIQKKEGKTEKSVELLRDAIAGFEKLIKNQPQAFPIRLQAIQTYQALVSNLQVQGKHREALPSSKRWVELFDEMLRDFPVFREPARSKWFHQQRVFACLHHLDNLLWANQIAEARSFASDLEKAAGVEGMHAYNMGCIYARLAEKTKDESQIEMDFAHAMEWLRKAQATGYPATADNVEHIRTRDPDLKSLRPRPEFQEWAKGLKSKK